MAWVKTAMDRNQMNRVLSDPPLSRIDAGSDAGRVGSAARVLPWPPSLTRMQRADHDEALNRMVREPEGARIELF
ncbi:hypothetical protein [Methyloversatilis universalis]|uniref:hypothetical protein n=1 Tax=Methyloversatilis universalis TaxID=378211 RepID=UPI0011124735|nr:hypothetical protein [Methyloversatilis universalis]